MKKTWYAAVLLLAGGLTAAVAVQWPEIKRYVKMRRM